MLPLPPVAKPPGGDYTDQRTGCAPDPGAVPADAVAVGAVDVGLVAIGAGYGAWSGNADVDGEGAFVAVDGFECMAKGVAPVSLGCVIGEVGVVEDALGH